MTRTVIERESLPDVLQTWLSAAQERAELRLFLTLAIDKEGKVIVEEWPDVDPEMMTRVRRATERFRPALERLAVS